MNDLLATALAAHGGLDRWNELGSVSANLSIGGVLWDLKGLPGLFAISTYEANLRSQSAVLGHFGSADRQVRFTPQRLVLKGLGGNLLAARDAPRDAFAGHVNETPWDELHAAYFTGYALWTYLTQPFLYTYPGFEVEEIEPWAEQGETWRRLKVRFPDSIASHTRDQISYFGPDGLLRRHDYAVDVLGGATGAHYVDDYRTCDGIRAPFRRRVFPLGADNQRVPEPVLISIDISVLRFAPAAANQNP